MKMPPSAPPSAPAGLFLASDYVFWGAFAEVRSLSRKSSEGSQVKHVAHVGAHAPVTPPLIVDWLLVDESVAAPI